MNRSTANGGRLLGVAAVFAFGDRSLRSATRSGSDNGAEYGVNGCADCSPARRDAGWWFRQKSRRESKAKFFTAAVVSEDISQKSARRPRGPPRHSHVPVVVFIGDSDGASSDCLEDSVWSADWTCDPAVSLVPPWRSPHPNARLLRLPPEVQQSSHRWHGLRRRARRKPLARSCRRARRRYGLLIPRTRHLLRFSRPRSLPPLPRSKLAAALCSQMRPRGRRDPRRHRYRRRGWFCAALRPRPAPLSPWTAPHGRTWGSFRRNGHGGIHPAPLRFPSFRR